MSTVFLVASFPLLVALLGASSGMRMITAVLSGESVDPGQKARILAAGIAETMSCDLFGGLVATGTAIVACVAAASAAATIDTTLASRGTTTKSFRAARAAAASGGAWLLATLAIGGLRLHDAGPLILLPALVVAVVVPFAVLAARGATVLGHWHDREEASRATTALFVAALSALLAMLAYERAIDAAATSSALSAITDFGDVIDPSQRTRILAAAAAATARAPASYAIHAVLGTVTFALALAPAIGRGPETMLRHPFRAGSAVALAMALALLGGCP